MPSTGAPGEKAKRHAGVVEALLWAGRQQPGRARRRVGLPVTDDGVHDVDHRRRRHGHRGHHRQQGGAHGSAARDPRVRSTPATAQPTAPARRRASGPADRSSRMPRARPTMIAARPHSHMPVAACASTGETLPLALTALSTLTVRGRHTARVPPTTAMRASSRIRSELASNATGAVRMQAEQCRAALRQGGEAGQEGRHAEEAGAQPERQLAPGREDQRGPHRHHCQCARWRWSTASASRTGH